MTIIYQQNIRNMYLAAGIMTNLTNGDPVEVVAASITLYGGVQPLASAIEGDWTSYNASYLLHLPSFSIQQPNAKLPATGIVIVNFGLPAEQLAANTGTATWAILWLANIAAGTGAGQIGGATLPATKFIILPVSDLTGIYPVRLSNTSLTAGSSYSIGDLNVLAVGGIA